VDDCTGVSDVVVASKPEHQTSCNVEYRLVLMSVENIDTSPTGDITIDRKLRITEF